MLTQQSESSSLNKPMREDAPPPNKAGEVEKASAAGTAHESASAKAAPPARKTGMARLLELAFTRKVLIICACVLAVISVALSFAPFIAIYYIIREIVLNYADLTRIDASYLMGLGWLAAGGAAAAILLNFVALMCSHIAAFTTLYKLKLDFLRHIASLPLGFHTANASGKLRKVVDENIEKLEGFIAHQLPDLAGSLAMPIFCIVILFVFDWRLGLASLVPIILSFFIYMVSAGTPHARAFLQKYQDSLETMNNAAVEYVRGVSVVKAFNQTIYSFRNFYTAIRDYGTFVLGYTMTYKRYMVLFMVIINNIYLFVTPVIILLVGGAENYGAFALAAVFYLIFSLALTGPFSKLLYVASQGTLIADNITRMDRILDIPPLPETSAPQEVQGFTVDFDDVSFAYGEDDDAEAPSALSHVSFTARQGEVTALVGPSGSGKSTLAHLLCRFYDVGEGAIRIGGTNVRDLSSDYLMSIVSFVFQDVFLFRQSVADNISIGRPGATRGEIVAAARAAQCHDFIERLPEGYDTVVGGSGVHLSGGERQRIVIARAILKDTPIIVLDEATAFADPENEHRIQLAFEELMKDKTVIIIAHRLSTVRGADTIVVLDEGRVVEQGSHEKLVATDGRYSHMWEEYNRALGWSLGAPATRPLEPLAEAAAWLDTNEHASSPPQSSAQSATPQKPQKHQGKEASHV